MVSLTPGCVDELNFWKVNLVYINGVPLWPIKRKPSRIVYSDASISACGSFITLDGKVFHQNWSDFERSQSSTFRELLAVLLSLQAFIDSIRTQTVVWYTDNQNVARIVSIGSKVPALQRMALDIHRLCLLASVSIDMQWIPRDLNIIADDISKFVDLDDYSINDGVFYSLDELWGPHTCDTLACHYNAKLPKFNTRFYQPGTSGVNAFAQDWSNDNNLLCPPVCLTCKVLSHLKVCNAAGTLVVPLWRSAYFWPRLCFDGLHWSGFVHDWVILPDLPNCLSEAKPRIQSSGAVLFHSLRWLCVLISVLHQGKVLGWYAKSSEFPICSTRCCFTVVTCNWLLQSFASIDWARCPIVPGGFLCFSTCCCFMIVTCDWMLRTERWLDALLPLMGFLL